MSVIEKITSPLTGSSDPNKVPKDVEERLKRGRAAMMKDAPQRRVCFRFFRGDQYCWVNDKNQISFLPTITYAGGGGKEPHRVRTKRNILRGLVEAKVSTATNVTPGYDITPTTTDPEAASAAKTAQKVAFYGYEKWDMRRKRVQACENALIADGAYAMATWDPNVGPFVEQEDGPAVGFGEVKILIFNGSQVAWEPGVDFAESPWYAVVRAIPKGEVENRPGFIGKPLKADASTADVPTDRPTDEMVLVVDYFERPTPLRPRGRKLQVANERLIAKEEDYPKVTPDGRVLDEPVLHQLTYSMDPDADRDLGLVIELIDPQRTLNDCVSKQIEWKNRCLNPQLLAQRGSVNRNQMIDDAPGRIIWYDGQQAPTWQQTPQMPKELAELEARTIEHMQAIAADPAILDATSAQPGTLAQIAQSAQQRWTTFLAEFAEFDAKLMRDCLYLVALNYKEPRLLELKGRWDWDNIPDFRGEMLQGQCNVRVDKSSLRAATRQEVKEDIQFWQTNYPGAVPVEAAMAAYYGGIADNMMLDFRLDIQRANEIIKSIKAGPEVLFNQPPQIRTSMDQMGQLAMQEVPWWMPGPSDNVRVWKHMIGSWMKTTDYMLLDDGMKAAADEIYNGLLQLEMQEAMRQQAIQTGTAQQQGMVNAAAPQSSALPSLPSANGDPALANQAGGTGA